MATNSFVTPPTNDVTARLNAMTPTPEPVPELKQRIEAAEADIDASQPAQSLRAIALRMRREGIGTKSQREAIQLSTELSQTGRQARINAHDGAYDAQLVKDVDAMEREINRVGASIMQAAPEFPPNDATHAAHINGVVADFDNYDPTVAVKVARDAIARRDLPLCNRLRLKLAGLSGWKKPFTENQHVLGVLGELEAVLATPDVIRSEAAKRWVEAATKDVRSFVNQMRGTHGAMDPTYIVVGAMPKLFPNREDIAYLHPQTGKVTLKGSAQ